MSLIHRLFQVPHLSVRRDAAHSLCRNQHQRQLFPVELETKFWFRSCKVGLGNIPGGKSRGLKLRVMKAFNIHGIVSWIQLNLSHTCGKLCTVRFSASSSGADVLYVDFDQVTQMAVS